MALKDGIQGPSQGGDGIVPPGLKASFSVPRNPRADDVNRALELIGFRNRDGVLDDIRSLTHNPYFGKMFYNDTLPRILNGFVAAGFHDPDQAWSNFFLVAIDFPDQSKGKEYASEYTYDGIDMMSDVLPTIAGSGESDGNLRGLANVGQRKMNLYQKKRLFHLLGNPKTLEALTDQRTIDLVDQLGLRSPLLAETFILTLAEFPQLKEEFLGPGKLDGFRSREAMASELDGFVSNAIGFQGKADMLRFYRNRETIRIGLNHARMAGAGKVSQDIANLGEVLTGQAYRISQEGSQTGFAVFFKGSYSRGTPTVLSDLDIVCVGKISARNFLGTAKSMEKTLGLLESELYDDSDGSLVHDRRYLSLRYDLDTGINPQERMFSTEEEFLRYLTSSETPPVSKIAASELRFVAGDRKFADEFLAGVRGTLAAQSRELTEFVLRESDTQKGAVKKFVLMCLAYNLNGVSSMGGVQHSLGEFLNMGFLERRQYEAAARSFDGLLSFKNDVQYKYGYPFISKPHEPPTEPDERIGYAMSAGYKSVADLDTAYYSHVSTLEGIRMILGDRLRKRMAA